MITTAYLCETGELIFRIFLACVLGITIGLERKNRNKCAGVRTHAIVALGSALMMVISKYGFDDMARADGARLAAQVVSGVGFLGAGIIFTNTKNNMVSGLTTAAGIWTTAGIGLCIGAGLYLIGVVSAMMIVLVQILMHGIRFFSNEAKPGKVRLFMSNQENGLTELDKTAERCHVEIVNVEISKSTKEPVKIEADVLYSHGSDKNKFLLQLASIDCVTQVKG